MTNSRQFAILTAAAAILGGNPANVWRCRFRNFGLSELPADNLIPEAVDAEYLDTHDTERKFRFHVRHIASTVDDTGETVDGADRAADARYVRAAQLLFADRTLGGNVRIIDEIGQKWEMESATQDLIALVVTYEVQFSTSNSDPSVAGY